MIPYAQQQITEEDIAAVTAALRSDRVTQGPVVPRFEAAMAGRCGADHALAVNSGTAALHLACLALEIGPGDTVWTSPITFVASANCARYCGADVDFVDIDPETGNMSVPALAEKLEQAKRTGRLPKALIPVHLAGTPCDMAEIGALARRYGVAVIEDASHAVGATRDGAPVGACTHSDLAVFSFHPVKIITTGEGGMALTNEPELATRMAELRSHGITRDPARMRHAPAGPWYYEQIDLGFNYRMTELQAALGLSQLDRLEVFLDRRRALAIRYDEVLAGLPLSPLLRPDGARSSLHLYIVRIDTNRTRRTHREIFEYLHRADIKVQLHYMPVHLQPYYRALGFASGDFPESEAYGREAMSLPLFPALSEAEQTRVIDALGEALA